MYPNNTKLPRGAQTQQSLSGTFVGTESMPQFQKLITLEGFFRWSIGCWKASTTLWDALTLHNPDSGNHQLLRSPWRLFYLQKEKMILEDVLWDLLPTWCCENWTCRMGSWCFDCCKGADKVALRVVPDDNVTLLHPWEQSDNVIIVRKIIIIIIVIIFLTIMIFS